MTLDENKFASFGSWEYGDGLKDSAGRIPDSAYNCGIGAL